MRTGDFASFSFVYDSSAAAIWNDPSGGCQYGLVSWTIAAGGGSLSGAGASDRILVYNDSNLFGDGGTDLFSVSVRFGYWAAVEFQDRGMDALDSTAIPHAFNSGDWDQQIFELNADAWFELLGSILAGSEQNVERPQAYFRVDAFYSSVPEPSTTVLLGIALAALALLKHRRESNLALVARGR